MVNCKSCKFSNTLSEEQSECRRNAPLLYPSGDHFVWFFPNVHPTLCWCGEYVEAVKEKSE